MENNIYNRIANLYKELAASETILDQVFESVENFEITPEVFSDLEALEEIFDL